MRLVYSQYCLILLFFFGVAEDTSTQDPELGDFVPVVPAPYRTVGIEDRVAAIRHRIRLERGNSIYEEETETDPEVIERRRQNRILARKLAFALSFFLFATFVLPILVRNGFVRIV
jgi:hypothetical protein